MYMLSFADQQLLMPLSSLSFVNSRYVLAFWYYLEIMPDALSVVSVVNRCNRKRYSHCVKIATRLNTQITFTCSKLTIETLEKGVKYVQS